VTTNPNMFKIRTSLWILDSAEYFSFPTNHGSRPYNHTITYNNNNRATSGVILSNFSCIMCEKIIGGNSQTSHLCFELVLSITC